MPLTGKSSQPQRSQSPIRTFLALIRILLLYLLLCAGLFLIVDALNRLHGEALDRVSHIQSLSTKRLPDPGINIELLNLAPTEQQAALARLAAHDIGWVRQRVEWAAIQPARDTYDWSRLDALMAEIERAGLTVMLVLDGSPAWARAVVDLPPTDGPDAPPADPVDFADFAGEVARRYQSRIGAYQLWDEPNIAPHWGNRHINPVHYAQLLKTGAQAIRRVDPEAWIVSGALAPTTDRGHTAVDEIYFLERMIAAGALEHVDAVAVQPFGFGDRADDLRSRGSRLNFARLLAIRRALVAGGAGNIPLIAARFGWNRQPGSPYLTVSAEEQVQFVTDAVALARAWPWLAGMAWAIDQPDRPTDDPLWGFAATDALLDALHPRGAASMPLRGQASDGLTLMLLGMVMVAISACRGYAAWKIAAARWPAHAYRRAPWWMQAGVWLGLLIAYHFTLWPPLILLWIALAALLIAMNPIHGLLLTLALLPLHIVHKEIGMVGRTALLPPSHALLLATVPALLLDLGRRRPRSMKLNHVDLLALGWFLISWGAVVHVWHWPAFWRGWTDLVLAPLLLYVYLRHWLVNREHMRLATVALACGGLLVALWGLNGWLRGSGTSVDGVRRLVGPHFSPNHSALYLERTFFLILGLTVAAYRAQRRSFYYGGLAGAVLSVGALLLTFSRGAFLLALPAGACVFVWLGGGLAGRPRRWPVAGFALGAAMLVVAGGVLAGPRLTNSATVLERLVLWRASLNAMVALFPAGTGPGGFYHHFAAFLPPGAEVDPNLRHPHNLWLETAISSGIAGLLWLAAFLAAFVAEGRRIATRAEQSSNRWIAAGLMAGLAAGLAHGQVDAYQALPDLAAWNWAALALLVVSIDTDWVAGNAGTPGGGHGVEPKDRTRIERIDADKR